MKKLLLILISSLLTLNLLANIKWEKVNTIYGGSVNRILEDSAGNLYSLVNTYFLYYSTNKGKTWIYQGKLPFYPYSIEIFNDTNLILGNSDGIYLSTTKGASWNFLGLNGKAVNTLAVVGKDTIFAGTNDGVWVSFNAGAKWIPSGLANNIISKLDISDNRTLYALLAHEFKLYYSTNLGKNWNLFEKFNTVENFHPGKENNVFILLDNSKRIYYTSYAEDTIFWEKEFPNSIHDFALLNDTTILALTYNTLYYTTFSDMPKILFSTDSLFFDFYNCLKISKSKEIFVGSEYKSVYYLVDLNLKPEIRNNGIAQTKYNYIKNDIDGNIYYQDHSGVWLKSTDGGISWNEFKFNVDFKDFLIDKYGRIWLWGRGLFLSTDGGNNFINLATNFNEPVCNYVKVFNQDTIFASITQTVTYSSTQVENTFIHRSTNGGLNWTKISFPYIDHSTPERFAFNSKCVLYSGFVEFYSSTDLGDSWINLGFIYPSTLQIIIDKHDNLFIGTHVLGIYFSTDGGKSFKELDFSKLNTSLNTMFYDSNNEILFAGTSSGVFYTFANSPFLWYLLNEGLDCLDIISFAMDDSGYLYIGTNDCGIYKTKFPISYLHAENPIKHEFALELLPNPASNSAKVKYYLNKSGYVSFEIINILGEKIFELDCGYRTEGLHFQEINLQGFSQGIYFVKINASGKVELCPLTILK